MRRVVVICAIALSAALAGCGTGSSPRNGGRAETPEEATASMQRMLRYLPDGFDRIRVINYAKLLQSPLLVYTGAPLDTTTQQVTRLLLRTLDHGIGGFDRRVVVFEEPSDYCHATYELHRQASGYVARFRYEDIRRTVWARGDAGDFVQILQLASPGQPPDLTSAAHAHPRHPWVKEVVGGHAMFIDGDFACCFPDGSTILTSKPDPLRRILARGGDATKTPAVQRLWDTLDFSCDLVEARIAPTTVLGVGGFRFKFKGQTDLGWELLKIVERVEEVTLHARYDKDAQFVWVWSFSDEPAAGAFLGHLEGRIRDSTERGYLSPSLSWNVECLPTRSGCFARATVVVKGADVHKEYDEKGTHFGCPIKSVKDFLSEPCS